MASCDTDGLLSDAKCLDCLTPRQLKILSIQLLKDLLDTLDPLADTSNDTLLDSAKCLQCLTEKQLSAMSVQMLCNLYATL